MYSLFSMNNILIVSLYVSMRTVVKISQLMSELDYQVSVSRWAISIFRALLE